MERADWHTFQVLTKRPERAAGTRPRLALAATTSGWASASRTPTTSAGSTLLTQIPRARPLPLARAAARARFRDLPLRRHRLGDRRRRIGPGRPADGGEWVIDIRDQCLQRRRAVLLQAMGRVQKSEAGRELDGGTSNGCRTTGRCTTAKDRWHELCKSVADDDGLPTWKTASPATERKLYAWYRYIEITTKAMHNSPGFPGGLTYVDLFAGSGICTSRTRRNGYLDQS